MFELNHFGQLAVASGHPVGSHPRFTVWNYRHKGEDMAAIEAPGYFNPVRDRMAVGDMVVVTLVDGASVQAAILHVCGKNRAVETELLTPGGFLLPPPLVSA